MDSECCPRCNGAVVVFGSARAFSPEGGGGCGIALSIMNPAWNPHAALALPSFWLCLSCGHTWTYLDPQAVRASIEANGDEFAWQYVKVLDAGPFHDVPELPEAREAASRVAEIDRLILTGREIQARRRFREMMHTDWNATISAITTSSWRNLTRPKKLALCGWHSKDEPPESHEHPMHDPLLDG